MTTDEFLRQQIIPLAYRQLPAAELMTRAGTGDPEAFIALVCLKYSHVESACRQVLGPTGPTEDVALEAFVQLWRQRERLRNVDAVDGWLTRTARNLARKLVRAQTRERRASRGWWRRTGEPAASASPPDRVAIQDEMVRRVRLAVAKQSDADQRMLWMAENAVGDADAAETLGLSVNSYRVRLHRARQRLRALLKKYGVAPVVGAVAFVGARANRASSAAAAWWATTTGKALLIGLVLCGAAAIACWAITRKPQSEVVRLPDPNSELTPPIVSAPVESLQARNKRIVQDELVPEIRDIVQRFYPPDNPIRLVDVRAFGSEVEIEFEATRPPNPNDQAARMRGRYCAWRRTLVVRGQPAGSDRWYPMNAMKPVVFNFLVPFVGMTEVVLGRAEYVAVEELFDRLPRDPRAESEHLRFLFGTPGGEFLLPARASGFAVDAGRMFLADGDMDLYVRDATGRWRFDGKCPGWWLIAHDGQLYCTRGDEILTRSIDSTGKPWVLWRTLPALKPGEKQEFMVIAGDRFYVTIKPDVHCYCPLADPKAEWVRQENTVPIWPDGITATADRFFAHNAQNVVTRPVREPSARWTPVARWLDGTIFLAIDGDRLLAYGRPGPIYARPLNAGPDVDWEIVGRAHEPPRRK